MLFNQPSRPLRHAVALACLALAGGAHAAGAVTQKNWTSSGTSNPAVGVGDSLFVTGYNGNANNWSDNSTKLFNAGWPHSGSGPWFSFQLTEAGNVSLSVVNATAGKTWTPGMTVWASGANQFDGGTKNADAAVKEVGPKSGINAPHSFNQVGQIGDGGTAWLSGADGNLLETLAYANSGVAHSDASLNDWGQVIHYGVHDVSVSNLYETAVGGAVGAGFATLTFANLQAGWYTIFVGGACTACGTSTFNMNLNVAAVPEPQTWALFAAGLGLVGFAVRRRARRA